MNSSNPKKKKSYHIVIHNGIYFNHRSDNAAFVKYIKTNDQTLEYIDASVYSTNRNMRMINQSKVDKGIKLKMESTGHAGGISNLVLEPGKYTEEELISSVDDGLYLTSMSGQGVNVTTGDYSRGAQGLWIRDGKLAEPVSEFTIASTFQQMLQNLDLIGCEVDTRNPILTPPFRINKMSISGS